MSSDTPALDPQEIIEQFAHDRFARLAGVRIVEVRSGYCLTEMTIADGHLNSIDTLHGGAIFTLGDIAFAAASNATGRVAVAMNVSVNFIRPGRSGKVTAEARRVAASRRTSTYDVQIRDEHGQTVAVFTGLAYHLDRPSGRAVIRDKSEPA